MERESGNKRPTAKFVLTIIISTIILIFGLISLIFIGPLLNITALLWSFGGEEKQLVMWLGLAAFFDLYLIVIYPLFYLILVPLTITFYNLKKLKALNIMILLMWLFNTIAIAILTISYITLACMPGFKNAQDQPPTAMVVSVSSDGNYAVSSNTNKKFVLWNIKDKKAKVISTKANPYSAYFIKNTDDFMWQDLNDFVHVQDVNGKEILKFHNFTTYGQVMTSDLQHYFASNKNWGIYSGYGKAQEMIKSSNDSDGILTANEQLLNLTLSNNNEFLLTSGNSDDCEQKGILCPSTVPTPSEAMHKNKLNGVITWDVNTGYPLRQFFGNANYTFATLSPDGRFAVSGDGDGFGLVWDTKSGKLIFTLWSLLHGMCTSNKFSFGLCFDGNYDYSKLNVNVPKDLRDAANQAVQDSSGDLNTDGLIENIEAMRFIDNTHYLRFPDALWLINPSYVILYSINNPQPLKYIKIISPVLKKKITYKTVRPDFPGLAVDTSPKAHILVFGDPKSNSIMVFKYDPQTQTLNKIWVGKTGWRLF